jgi:hypothetical protein
MVTPFFRGFTVLPCTGISKTPSNAFTLISLSSFSNGSGPIRPGTDDFKKHCQPVAQRIL